ncbi:MAG: MarR family winged helix-turn-helix transcriptional regulator [Gaiellaceae bacterium]
MPADDDIAIPALLRAARGAYGNAIRSRLAAADFDDLPRNAAFILGGMGSHGISAGDLVGQLGVSKQAAGQLIDALVVRGYLERQTNPDDRRRMTLELTPRGKAAALEVRAGVQEVDTELATQLTSAQLGGLRAGLIALTTIREAQEEAAR